MKGRHTATAIFEMFHGIMVEFGLQDKLVRVVSDNAANMKKAFTLGLEVLADKDDEIEGDGAISAGEDDFEENLPIQQHQLEAAVDNHVQEI